jgi:hypothetical protein
MLSTPPQNYHKVRFGIRPVKHAYFVRENDMEAMRRIMTLACTQWGGIRSIILPLDPDLTIQPLYMEWLALHEPDWFVAFVSLEEFTDVMNSIRRQLQTIWPHKQIGVEHGGHYETTDITAHAVGVLPDTIRLPYPPSLNAISFAGTEFEKLELLSIFGEIYPGQEQNYLNSGAVAAIGGEWSIRGPSGDPIDAIRGFWSRQFGRSTRDTVLSITGYHVRPYHAVNNLDGNSVHFDIVLATSIRMLCIFWNIRAPREALDSRNDLGRRVILLPNELIEDQAACQELVNLIKERIEHPSISTRLHLRFHVENEAQSERLVAMLTKLVGVKAYKEKKSDKSGRVSTEQRSTARPKINQLTYAIPLIHMPRSFLESFDLPIPQNVRLEVGINEIPFEPPPEFLNKQEGTVAVDFSTDYLHRYPLSHNIAQTTKAGSWFSKYGLTWVGTINTYPDYQTFNFMNEWETLESFFRDKGLQIERSDRSQYAEAFINLVDGLDGLRDTLSKLAYEILKFLAPQNSEKLARQYQKKLKLEEDKYSALIGLIQDQEIVAQYGAVSKTLSEISSNITDEAHKKESHGIISTLTAKGIIRRGWKVKCPNCGTTDWFPLDIAEEILTCPGCSYSFPLPAIDPGGGDMKWEYTLNTLTTRIMDQDILPEICAISYLSKDRQINSGIVGLRFLQDSIQVKELDFVFISEHQLFSGECKASGEIRETDIERAEFAARLGIQHFYFATLGRFSTESKDNIKTLQSKLTQEGCTMTINILDENVLFAQ